MQPLLIPGDSCEIGAKDTNRIKESNAKFIWTLPEREYLKNIEASFDASM